MWTHWRNLANTIERVLPLAHPNPQPTRQISTAHGRKSLYFTMGRPFPLKTIPPHLDSNLIHSYVAHPSPQPKRHLDRFSRFAGLTRVTDRQTTLLGR